MSSSEEKISVSLSYRCMNLMILSPFQADFAHLMLMHKPGGLLAFLSHFDQPDGPNVLVGAQENLDRDIAILDLLQRPGIF